MISNTVRGLINLALSNLELEDPTQETINKATNYLKEAVLQIKKEKEETEEEPQEHKVWLFNALYDTNYYTDSCFNCLTGEIRSQGTYKCTHYIEIPEGVKTLTIVAPIHGGSAYHVGGLFDENKQFLYGICSQQRNDVKYIMTSESLTFTLEGNEKYIIVSSSSSGSLCSVCYTTTKKEEKVFEHESNKTYTVNTITDLKTLDARTGDTIITNGYYSIGDNGRAVYDVISYEEFINLLPKDIVLMGTNTQLTKTPVDEYGNHTLNNGLVARLKQLLNNGEQKVMVLQMIAKHLFICLPK